MITESQLVSLKAGDGIEYSYFKGVEFVDKDQEHVFIKDKFGFTKKVYRDLFLKHAVINREG